jgi:putative phosphoesterase
MAKAKVAATSKLVRRHASVPLGPDGSLRIAVVADTHSEPHPRATELVAAERPACILHAGDIGDLAVLTALERVAPVHAVRGNIDVRASDLPDVLTLDVRDGDATVLRLLLFHIAVYGPKLRADAARLAREEGASLVVCGHSHVPFLGRDRDLAIFNPGSIGPRRFHLPIVYGVIELRPERVAMHHVDCETGQRWAP